MKANGLSALYCDAAAVGCADVVGCCDCAGDGVEKLGCGESTGANENSPLVCVFISSNIIAWCASIALVCGCEAGMGNTIGPRFTGVGSGCRVTWSGAAGID